MPPPGMNKRPPMGAGPRDLRDEGRRDPFNPSFGRPNSRPSSRPGSQPGSREGSRSRDQIPHRAGAGDRSRGSSPYRASPTPPPSREQQQSRSEPKPSSAPTKELSNSEIEKKTKSMMEEFLSVQDMKEAVACVEEMGVVGGKKALIVETILLQVVESTSTARGLSGRLCLDLIKRGLLNPEQFVEGSISVLSMAEDLIIDIPQLWKFFGEIFGCLITSAAHFPLKHFAKLCDSLKAGNFSGKFLAATLKVAENSLGRQTLATCWSAEAPSLEDMIGKNVDDFLDSNDLRFLVSSSADDASDVNSAAANIPSPSYWPPSPSFCS